MVSIDSPKIIKTKFGNARLNSSNHYQISSRKEGNHGKFLHRLIYEDYYKVTLLEGVVIHHLDNNPTNNDINNLKAVYHDEHSYYHNKGSKHTLNTRLKLSKKNNSTGFYRVFKRTEKRNKQGYAWTYYYRDDEQHLIAIENKDLVKLKEKVLSQNMEWFIIDYDAAMRSLKENEEMLLKSEYYEDGYKSRTGTTTNKTGYYKVYKSKNEETTQGFIWSYSYEENSKRKTLSSYDLNKLKDMVEKRGFLWKIVDIEKAMKSDELNKRCLELHCNDEDKLINKSKSINTTGYFRVSKLNRNNVKQGYIWAYTYTDNYKVKSISSVNLIKLKEKVMSRNLLWSIIDKDNAIKTCDEHNILFEDTY